MRCILLTVFDFFPKKIGLAGEVSECPKSVFARLPVLICMQVSGFQHQLPDGDVNKYTCVLQKDSAVIVPGWSTLVA
jgi:hypothetical protein